MFIPIKNISKDDCQFSSPVQSTSEGKVGLQRFRQKKTLTCPIIFKAVKEMEDHHDQCVKRDECNVHLGK